MATDLERLVVSLEANVTKYERSLAKAMGQTNVSAMRIETRFKTMNKNIEKSFDFSGLATRGLAALGIGLSGAASFKAVSEAAQKFTALQNSLKVTGLEGAELEKTFSSLFQIAQKNGTAIEPLTTLYSRASQAQKELKASSEDLLKFTDGISIALRVAGTNSTQAAGALLQLSQAIGSGVVRAEEFNSVNEGARPILQAVAAGLKEAGGSVSTLKNLVNEGKVSSEAFFRAFLAGMPQLEAQAAKADGTIGQANERISNAFIALVGHLDKTTGASSNAAKGLNAIADVVEKLGGYFDAASSKLETLQKWLSSVGSNPAWTTLAKFFGADFSPEEMAKYGLTPVSGAGQSG
ncbi:tape measure protein, partial [Nitrobacter sp.]|uniref:tape measure protein n=1 Tax=Nitrobacter sp. TaxID=29420 RepID=UPI001E02DD66